jgi:hypothetical protein
MNLIVDCIAVLFLFHNISDAPSSKLNFFWIVNLNFFPGTMHRKLSCANDFRYIRYQKCRYGIVVKNTYFKLALTTL